MTRQEETNNAKPGQTWDEPRIVVMLIGLCLIIESILIYYQAGQAQIIIASITAVSGITLLLFSLLVSFDEKDTDKNGAEKTQEISKSPAVRPEEIAKEPERAFTDTDEPVTLTVQPPIEEEIQRKAPAEKEKLPEPDLSIEEPVKQGFEPEKQPEVHEEPAISWFQRLKAGLKKTRDNFVVKLKHLVIGKVKIDADLLDELEATLFESDIGVKTAQELLSFLNKKVEEEEIKDPERIFELLKSQLRERLTKYPGILQFADGSLTVFLIIGVNGVGKTTTIAKLAHKYITEGKKVILAAGDTFRAAAIDQISIWGERAGAEVIRGNEGADPGALVFDAIHAARKRQAELLIIDTAGRMHVKTNLMDELKKIRKIVEKECPKGPHETLLVLDATTGQNAVQQAKLFNEALPISGLVITKLDGTAKGGIIFAVEEQINAPVKFIGVGEKMDDLMPFDPEEFLSALFDEDQVKAKTSDYQVL